MPVYFVLQMTAKSIVLLDFMQIGCDLVTPSPGHDVTGQRKNLAREWEA